MTEGTIEFVDLSTSLSDRSATSHAMASLLANDPEEWAQLSGLLSQLALPPVRCGDGRFRKRFVEVEVVPNRWVPIEGASIDMEQLLLWSGGNGTRIVYRFVRGEKVPRWRSPAQAHGTLVED